MANGKQPSSAGYWIGALLIVVSIGAGIGGFVGGFAQLVSQIDDMTAVPVGTETTLDLSAKTYWVYDTSSGYGSVDVEITGPDGQDVPVRIPTVDGTASSGSTTYTGIGEFTAPSAGSYTIAVEGSGTSRTSRSGSGSSSNNVYIGPAFGELFGTTALWIGVGMVGGTVLFLIGLVLLIVTGVRRSKWKKQNRPPMQPMGGGYGGGYPQPGGYQPPPAPGGYQPPPAPGGYQPPPAPGGYQPTPPPAPGPYQPPPQQGGF